MKRVIYLLILSIFIIVSLSACSDEKVYHPYDIALKEYSNLSENKGMVNASEHRYDEYFVVYTSYGNDYISKNNISVLMANDKYSVGIIKTPDFPLSWTDYVPGIYYTETNNLEYAFTMNTMQDIGVSRSYHNYKPVYYNPYNEKYEEIVKVKEISENKTVISYTCIKYMFPRNSKIWLFPYFMSDVFYNKVAARANNKGLNEELKSFTEMYTKTTKEKFTRIYTPDSATPVPMYFKYYYKGELKTDVFCEDFYYISHHVQNNDLVIKNENINVFLQRLGFTEKDIRKELLSFGFDGSDIEAFVIEVTIEMLPDKPVITFNAITLSPEGADYNWLFEKEEE